MIVEYDSEPNLHLRSKGDKGRQGKVVASRDVDYADVKPKPVRRMISESKGSTIFILKFIVFILFYAEKLVFNLIYI